jgi:mRNA interferase MazF
MVTKTPYQPDRGDYVWLDFTPHAGTEQGGRRPALILSPRNFNVATGLAMACPMTSQVKGGSFEVLTPKTEPLSGAILCDHLKSVDWLSRRAEFRGRASSDVMDNVLARIAAILGLELP